MRNVHNDNRAGGTTPERGGSTPPWGSHGRRRKQAIVGAAGLVAALGVGAVALAGQLGDSADTGTTTNGAAPVAQGSASVAGPVAPEAPPAADTPPTKVPPVAASRPATGPPARTAAPASTPMDKAVSKQVAAARSSAAADGIPLKRPVPQATAAGVPDNEIKVVNSGDVRKDRTTLRVVSARGDLTGRRELAWAADDGHQVGDARCTQTIRLSNNATAAKRPTLLLCWRISATKSVYTVMVDLDRNPSEQKSVAAIDSEWRRLG